MHCTRTSSLDMQKEKEKGAVSVIRNYADNYNREHLVELLVWENAVRVLGCL